MGGVAMILYDAKTGEITEIHDIEQNGESQPTLDELRQQLTSTDYKIIKCYEYQLIGESLPYDIVALHNARQTIRDKINELEV
jgi:hypothetical protein